ncbi:RagB/SusD family nutrient uptake outer membrane protein [Dyadobacter psychrophilus]|uniref:SusD family protein n=1 Tax=Dyadobacter psychrophilus TaxID=651661 RepID=A0A1T5HCT8_9BACT|nr:RagB/SusD family nutrient uptake outer membrane protein [Dyadobacter psychrophilus]SKC18515.1 SusD family protein [Dyadobacter psychrophilus]
MEKLRISALIALLAALGLLSGCQTDWLDVKRSKSDVMPASLADLQAILDNNIVVNSNYPMLGLVGSDNIYIPDERLGQAALKERNAYLWNADIYRGGSASEFSGTSQKIAYANIVLERLQKLSAPAQDNIKGQALFLRAYALHAMAQLFCKPFNQASAAGDVGLQIRHLSDPSHKVARSSVLETYQSIAYDATQAFALLAERPLYVSRPSKAAAAGLLARMHLNMGEYDKALEWADAALKSRSELLDFNVVDKAASGIFAFAAYSNKHQNPEVIFYAEGATGAATYGGYGVSFADTLLARAYKPTDLRKALYFIKNANGLFEPAGSYTGSISAFYGVATNEIYLIKAECLARLGQHQQGVALLNKLLTHRYQTGKYVAVQAGDAPSALKAILDERRKELAFYGHARWSDLRRLNLQQSQATTITRISGGTRYQLLPNSQRYVLPFPDLELQLSGITQNPR